MATHPSASARRGLARRVALLEGLSDDQLDELLDRCALERRPASTVLFAAGEPARGLTLIAEGEVVLHLEGPTGQRLVVGRLRMGEVLGELSVLDGRPPVATATAATEVLLYRLEARDLGGLLEARRPVARTLLRRLGAVVTRRLRLLDHQLQRARRGMSDVTLPPTEARRLEPLGEVHRQRVARHRHLRALSPADRAPLLDAMRLSAVPAGGVLFHEASPAWACYLVLEGSIEVLVQRRGRLDDHALVEAGSLISPLAILDIGTHAATCRAHERSLVVELRRPAFEALLDAGQDGAWRLMQDLLGVLAGQLRRAMRHTLLEEARRGPGQRTEPPADDFLLRAQAGLGDFDLDELLLLPGAR